ncbi:hypothetical protein evm_015072 [Chilo suppressalis]|nr:hypothetical protein evm_015072 [Chilo suppressalis]
MHDASPAPGYLRDVESSAGVEGYRFTPPEDVFADNENNKCFCPAGPPCAPNGLFNVSLCQYDSPIMLSFPHFYLADKSLLDAVEGISPPDPEKHRLFIDVQPVSHLNWE